MQPAHRAKELHSWSICLVGDTTHRIQDKGRTTGENRGEQSKVQVIKIQKLHQAQLK